jgi:hypothetical protein
MVRQLLYELSESWVLSEVRNSKDKEFAYQSAIDVDKMTIKFVIDPGTARHIRHTNDQIRRV